MIHTVTRYITHVVKVTCDIEPGTDLEIQREQENKILDKWLADGEPEGGVVRIVDTEFDGDDL